MAVEQTIPSLQIFATDISESALRRARAGVYPLAIEEDVSAERLRRFSSSARRAATASSRTFETSASFARQDVSADPPFSNLDLISCRNLLIYLEPSLQKAILPRSLHYALKPDGFLLLGASETIRNFEGLFAPQDKQHRLFMKKNESASRPSRPSPPHSAPGSSGGGADPVRAAHSPETGVAGELQRRA